MLLQINSHQIRDNAIITQLIADANVTNAKLASGIDAAKIADGSVSNTEFQYLNGVTSAIQTQIDNEASARSSADTTNAAAIAAEQTRAEAAEGVLQDNIDAEATARAAADTAIRDDLASTANAKGASLVGVEDAGDLFTGADVEAVLAEIQGNVAAEATARAAADTTEATARAAGDATNATAISNEVTRAEAAEAGLQSDIDTLAGGDLEAKVNRSGDTMSGPLLMTTNTVAGDNALQVPTKGYVDGLVSGLLIKTSVRVATTAALPANTLADGPDNANPGVGATLTADANGAFPDIDDVTLQVGDRILVKDEPGIALRGDTAGSSANGVFVVTDLGSAGTPWVLTRAEDFDDSPDGEVADGSFVFVGEGTLNHDNGFVQTDNSPVTVNAATDGQLVFTQFSGAGQIIAGAALSKTGNQLDVNVDDSTIEVNGTDQLRLKDGGITTAKIADGAVTDAKIDSVAADKVTVANGTGLSATDVQAALAELKTDIDNVSTSSGSDVSDLQAAVGSSDLAGLDYSSNNYVTDATSLKEAVGDLDTALKAEETARLAADATQDGRLDALETFQAGADADYVNVTGDTMTGHLEINATSGNGGITIKGNDDSTYGGQVNVINDSGRIQVRGTSDPNSFSIIDRNSIYLQSTYGGSKVLLSGGGNNRIDGNFYVQGGYFAYDLTSDSTDFHVANGSGGIHVTRSGSTHTNTELAGTVTIVAAGADTGTLTIAGLTSLNGGATVPTGKVITITDAPTADTDGANKKYVDDQDAATLATAEAYTDAETTRATAAEAQIVSDLASTANGEGASLVGIEDAAGKFTATTVEGALAEIAAGTTLDSRYVNVAGDTMTGHLQLNAGLGMNLNGNTVQINGGASGEIFQITGSDNLFTVDTQAETIVMGVAGKLTTVNGNMTVGGNLTVNGTVTHVNSTTVDIEDNMIQLASNVDGDAVPNVDGGIAVKRFDGVTEADAMINWNEANGNWEAGKDGDISALVRYAELTSTSAGNGASKVGIQDVGAYYTSTNVEGALQEIGATLGGGGGASVNDRLAALEGIVAINAGDTVADVDYASNNYIADGTTLEVALGALDTQLFTTTSDLASEVSRATAAEAQIVSDLASTASGKGASTVGIYDTANYFTSTTVEGALAELGANGANGPLHQGYDELLVDSTIETANASGTYDITLSNATAVDGQFIKVFINGALQVFDNGSNTSMPTAYTKTDNSTITIKQALLTAGDVIQVHYNY